MMNYSGGLTHPELLQEALRLVNIARAAFNAEALEEMPPGVPGDFEGGNPIVAALWDLGAREHLVGDITFLTPEQAATVAAAWGHGERSYASFAVDFRGDSAPLEDFIQAFDSGAYPDLMRVHA